MSFFSDKGLYYLLALCNTNVVKEILNVVAPTIHCQCGDVANIPVFLVEDKKNNVSAIAISNVQLSQQDWDSYETSWDFKRSPLV